MTEIHHLRKCAQGCLKLAEATTDLRIVVHLRTLAADANKAADEIETANAWLIFQQPPDDPVLTPLGKVVRRHIRELSL